VDSRDRYKDLLLYSATDSTQDTDNLSKPADFFLKQHDHKAADTYAEFAIYVWRFVFVVPYSCFLPGMREAHVTAQQSF